MDLNCFKGFEDKLPSNLTKLVLYDVRISEELWKQWSRVLSSTLRVLEFKPAHTPLYDFHLLHNVREFKMDFFSSCVPRNFDIFLKQNKTSLERLGLIFDSGTNSPHNYTDPRHKISRALAQLSNLKRLCLINFKPDFPCDLTGLPHLEEVDIEFPRRLIVNKGSIKKLAMIKFTQKYYASGDVIMNIADLDEFTNLEELDLRDYGYFASFYLFITYYKPLQDLKRLKMLRVNGVKEWEVVKKILIWLPYLTQLEMVNVHELPLDFEYQLKKYLEENNRSLRIGDGKLNLVILLKVRANIVYNSSFQP